MDFLGSRSTRTPCLGEAADGRILAPIPSPPLHPRCMLRTVLRFFLLLPLLFLPFYPCLLLLRSNICRRGNACRKERPLNRGGEERTALVERRAGFVRWHCISSFLFLLAPARPVLCARFIPLAFLLLLQERQRGRVCTGMCERETGFDFPFTRFRDNAHPEGSTKQDHDCEGKLLHTPSLVDIWNSDSALRSYPRIFSVTCQLWAQLTKVFVFLPEPGNLSQATPLNIAARLIPRPD